jgi:hypothetical protein
MDDIGDDLMVATSRQFQFDPFQRPVWCRYRQPQEASDRADRPALQDKRGEYDDEGSVEDGLRPVQTADHWQNRQRVAALPAAALSTVGVVLRGESMDLTGLSNTGIKSPC